MLQHLASSCHSSLQPKQMASVFSLSALIQTRKILAPRRGWGWCRIWSWPRLTSLPPGPRDDVVEASWDTATIVKQKACRSLLLWKALSFKILILRECGGSRIPHPFPWKTKTYDVHRSCFSFASYMPLSWGTWAFRVGWPHAVWFFVKTAKG